MICPPSTVARIYSARSPPAGRSVAVAASKYAGRGALHPAMCRISGKRNRNAETKAEDGLPGRPRTTVFPTLPAIKGFPGRIATFQKSICAPIFTNAVCTRSWSPTDAPPVVTMISTCSQSANRLVSSAVTSSRKIPASRTSQGRPASMACNIGLLEQGICAGPIADPAGTNSSPVAANAMRGTPPTVSLPCPAIAATAMAPASK